MAIKVENFFKLNSQKQILKNQKMNFLLFLIVRFNLSLVVIETATTKSKTTTTKLWISIDADGDQFFGQGTKQSNSK